MTTIKHFLKITLSLLCIVLISTGCGSRHTNTTIISYASEGLNLKAVTDAAIKSKNAEEFEKKLNTKGNKINNLDLDEDNKVDYIKVTEINEDKMKGFSLTVEIAPGQEQEICTIQFEKDGTHGRVQSHGNHHIYGNHHYYHRRTSLSDMLIMGYMYNNHPPYRSRYGYGNYPSHFSSSAPISKDQYSGFHSSQPYSKEYTRATTSHTTSSFTSPNANKVASNIKAPLLNPSTSQKAFQKSNPSRSVRSTSSSRFGGSSSFRSGSSFGGGK